MPKIYGKKGYLFKIWLNLPVEFISFLVDLISLGGRPSFSLLLASPINLKELLFKLYIYEFDNEILKTTFKAYVYDIYKINDK